MIQNDMPPVPVVLDGVETPVFLRNCGPPLEEGLIVAFERELGYRLPSHYRAFLLACNGGRPVVEWFLPRHEDACQSPRGCMVASFLGLPTSPKTDDTPGRPHLELPSDSPFGLPRDVLEIGGDGCGNIFVIRLAGPRCGQILFVDHEQHLDLASAPVMADDMLDWLLRFRTIERQTDLDREEQEAERKALESGSLPAALRAQIRRTAMDPAVVERSIRTACLDVHEDKGHFSLHADAKSHLVFDLIFWLLSASRPSPGVERDDMHEAMFDWWRESDDGFGLRGFGPGYVDLWWDTRLAEGHLEPAADGKLRLSDKYVADLLAKLR